MACCRDNGIYIDLNLNVSRAFTVADGIKQADWMGYGKALTYFDPQLLLLQREYAAQLLGHLNPFTVNRYAEEPTIAIIELVNENSILESWTHNRLRGEQIEPFGTWGDIPLAYARDLDRLWNDCLARKYPDRQALAEAWNGDLRDYEDAHSGSVRRLRPEDFASASKGRFRDEATFYAEMERGFFEEMASFLRKLGARQLILGTSDHNHGWHGALHVEDNSVLGIVDGHCYWQHPRFPRGTWSRTEWFITNTPMVDAPDHCAPAQLSRSRVEGMPYIVSELNEPFPHDYAPEFIPIMAAYALLQDWDGLFYYSYGGGTEEQWRDSSIPGFSSMGNDAVKMPQTGIGALIFLRGDVRSAEKMVERRLTHDWVIESMRSHTPDDQHPYSLPHLVGRLALVHRTAVADFHSESLSPIEGEIDLPQNVIRSDTGELLWEDTPGDGRVLIDTPRYQAIIGRAGQRSTSNVTLALETSFAAVQIASLDERPLSDTEGMLLVAGARVANAGMEWADDTRRSLSAWGHPPTRTEGVAATLTLRALEGARSVSLQPLDGRGQPMGAPSQFRAEGDHFAIRLTSDPPTPWYLVEVKR